MAISNVNNSNGVSSTSRVSNAPAVATRKAPTRDDSGDGSVVTLSSKARSLSEAERANLDQKQHIERIQTLSRADQQAQEKMDVNAREEAKALAASQKEDEQLYKRINTYA
jgi:hypothetical protein